MHASSFLIVILTALAGIAIVAKRYDFPYPIAFVIGGALMAFVPNLPRFELDPNYVFLLILPPLLYSGGWTTDARLFMKALRPIALLAVGLVIATTIAVALVAHATMPELSWAAAIALGAIVSPPDAVAAGAVFERFSVPRRIVTILEGEGLVNDATALVIYRFAVAAVVTGAFSAPQAAGAFVYVAVGGVAVGIAIGYAFTVVSIKMQRWEIADAQIANIIFLLVPYLAYVGGEAVHVSGVLATVVAGAIGGRKASVAYDAESRLVAASVWEMMIFVFNGLVFILIGLQLREIVSDPHFAIHEIWIGIAISALVIVVRLAWVYPATYLPRILFPSIARTEPLPPPRYIFIIGWSGMRGILSLAAALAVPLTDRHGHAFPGRSEIIFITFCVIFATLVFQGISLLPILRWLKIDAGEDLEQQEMEFRVSALRAGIARLRQLEPDFGSTTEWEVEGRIVQEYEYRIGHLLGHADRRDGVSPAAVDLDHRLQEEALTAERREIARMRDSGAIPDEVFRKIQYDLDLATARLT